MTASIHHNSSKGKANSLIREKSPYLLQHAHNPVDWYAWRKEAFEKATREDKPIFLSIGYSTCHWCHVMEKESFEDPHVASLMNEAFVCVKVDREERPDLDHIYMTVCNMMTGSGGWPLTIIMTPDKEPFFAATYIPKDNRYGRMGMLDLIPRIRHVWHNRRKDVLENAANVRRALMEIERRDNSAELDRSVLDRAFGELRSRFDPVWGGFGEAPKFPAPHNIMFLLRYWKKTGSAEALHMVEKTLREMRQGGIFDHLGYGFHRYSTDRRWLVPHFEKMLYDQALLALAYLEAYQATRQSFYAETAREILAYVLRDMRSPEGGFFSAEDADSEGEEGKFYLWSASEIREALLPEEASLAMEVFNIRADGNFIDEATGRATGANILHISKPLADKAKELGVENLSSLIEEIRRNLFDKRQRRVHPHKDDKILTDWNGLMIAALARAAQVLGDAAYEAAAREAAQWLLRTMRREDGRLLHRWRDGDADIDANLDDYAFVQWGLLELYEADFDPRHLAEAIRLCDFMLGHFIDQQGGGFYFAPDDAADLIVRKKELYDGAIPSGNSVAFLNLLRLSRITGNNLYEDAAAGIIKAFSGQAAQLPSGYTHFLCGLDFALGPSHEIVVAGPKDDPGTIELIKEIRGRFLPNRVLLLKSSDDRGSALDEIAGFAAGHGPVKGRPAAYICSGYSCRQPVTEISELREALP